MRIGLSSIVGDGFGTGSFQISEIAGVISFPPAGSYNSTLYGVEYPVAQGGSSFADPTNGAAPPIPNQICDVDVENDGVGGTYTDWTTATNIQYKTNGQQFLLDPVSYALLIEVPSGSGMNYQGGVYQNEYYHDGLGSFYSQGVNQSYYNNGTDTNIEFVGNPQTAEVPSGSGNYYDNGRTDGYTWDGFGSYNYPVTKGSYYPNGTLVWESVTSTSGSTEVPASSGQYYDNTAVGDQYLWNGSGGYNYNSSWYYPYGTFIYWDGVNTDYYWDGSGGFYSVTI